MNQFDLLSAESWKVGLTAITALFGYNSQLGSGSASPHQNRVPAPFTISIVITQSQLHIGSSNMPKAVVLLAVVDNFFVCLYIWAASSSTWRQQQSESHRNADLAGFSEPQCPGSRLPIYGKQALNQRQSRNLGGKTETTAKI
ncbi:GD17929 [Drosophila simulans]|uniref:GD17929 n=1 Tax=Drosophila simulans TaxID=7240 RepID=B4QJD9_DROSI|nr:GD17929 [Drosophila simulans]